MTKFGQILKKTPRGRKIFFLNCQPELLDCLYNASEIYLDTSQNDKLVCNPYCYLYWFLIFRYMTNLTFHVFCLYNKSVYSINIQKDLN